MTTVRISKGRRLRIWCFDVEARPGPWGGGDFTYRRMLSLAGAYDDDPEGTMAYVGPGFGPKNLERFVRPLRQGGVMVLTHNGDRYDLPFLNGTLLKMGLEPLQPLLFTDTLRHIPKRGLAFSAGLGNLAQRFEVGHEKDHMSEVDWDLAYDGDPDALEKLRTYNIGDVLTTIKLRRKEIELGMLGPPRVWRP